ncbi:MAG: hypothetical protein ABI617_02985 [Sphingomicrobium sp.]
MLFETLLALLAAAPPLPPVKPWAVDGDVGCHWWLSGPNGKEHHASIGQGDDDPVLTVSDKAFMPFAETDEVPLVLRFSGDPMREAAAVAWSSSVVGDGERMLGMYLRAPARKAMGGATRIEILHHGKVLADIPLAATPSQAVLDACVVPPNPNREDESGG